MSNVSVKVVGLDELISDLEKMAKKYPDVAGDLLKDEAKRTRKQIVNNARTDTNTKSKSKNSLGKIGSYRISQPQGYGANLQVEISSKSKHFHLVERGHTIVMPYTTTLKSGKKIKLKTGGQVRGRVKGKFYLKKAVEEENEVFDEAVERMLDGLLDYADLK